MPPEVVLYLARLVWNRFVMDRFSRIQLVTTKKKENKSSGGKKSNVEPLKPVKVSLDGLEVKLALRLGDGDLTLGIRRAVVLAGMRQF